MFCAKLKYRSKILYYPQKSKQLSKQLSFLFFFLYNYFGQDHKISNSNNTLSIIQFLKLVNVQLL